MKTRNDTAIKTGGLYAKINMSVRGANIMVTLIGAALVLVIVAAVACNGFTVKFDTDGGSYIKPVRAMYSERISPERPTKEGFRFIGWYTDRDCTELWRACDTVSGSMTLYAGWEKLG